MVKQQMQWGEAGVHHLLLKRLTPSFLETVFGVAGFGAFQQGN